jgi:hypothetical protein
MRKKSYSSVLFALAVLLVTASCYLITTPRGPLKFEPATLPDAQVGVPYDARITISGNVTPVMQFSTGDGQLPDGLSLQRAENEDAVRIVGTPSAPGTFTFKVFAWCYGTNVSGQEGNREYTITVQ